MRRAQRIDPNGKRGLSPYMLKLLKGHAAYAGHNFSAAISAYQEAISSEPALPGGYYLRGEVHAISANHVEADASYRLALSKADKDEVTKAKALFVAADLRERQGQWDEAKKAWTEYAQFVQAHPQANGHPATAVERVKRLDERGQLAKQSEAVKQRIEQRLKEAAGKGQAAPAR